MVTMPQPVLDDESGDQVVAEIIASFPDELSDRSDANAAVVIAEAIGIVYDKYIYQLNALPLAYVQQQLSMIGSPLKSPNAAISTQIFTLVAPQQTDTVMPAGTVISTNDGSLSVSTLSDVTIPAYQSFYDGYLTITLGSTTVTSTAPDFVTGSTWVGQQIQVVTSGSGGTWYTIASVTSTSSLQLTEPATANAGGAGTSFNVGPVTSTAVQVQATTTGAATNVGSGKLTQASVANLSSTTNITPGVNGNDLESAASGIARAQAEFAKRDIACSEADYEAFATATLGPNSRAFAKGNFSGVVATPGYVSVAMLSPNWTTSSSISAQEINNVMRDLAPRAFVTSTTLPLAANIQTFQSNGNQPVVCVYRDNDFSAAHVQVSVAQKLNALLSPNTYPNGRTIYTDDLGKAGEATGVDRVHAINGVLAVGMNYTNATGTYAFANGSTTVASMPSADVTAMTAGSSFIMDLSGTTPLPYLVVAKLSSTSVQIDRGYTASTATVAQASLGYFTSKDTALTNWYSLPFASLSTDLNAPPATIFVVGSVVS